MASITPSALISEIRGKVGSEIFSKNRGGTYTKTYFVPANPNTTHQQFFRAIYSDATAEWKAAAQEDRDAFAILAENHPMTNELGQVIKWTGFNLFVSLWTNMVLSGGSGFLVPAEPIDMPVLNPTVVADVSAGITITLNPSFGDFSIRAIAYASAPVSPTINYFSVCRVNYFGNRRTDIGTPWNATTAYTTRHGSLAGQAGNKIMFRFRCAHSIIGWALPDVWVPVIIVP